MRMIRFKSTTLLLLALLATDCDAFQSYLQQQQRVIGMSGKSTARRLQQQSLTTPSPLAPFGVVVGQRDPTRFQLRAHAGSNFDGSSTNSYLSSLSSSRPDARTTALQLAQQQQENSGDDDTNHDLSSKDDDQLLELLQSQAGGVKKRRRRKQPKKQASTRQVSSLDDLEEQADDAQVVTTNSTSTTATAVATAAAPVGADEATRETTNAQQPAVVGDDQATANSETAADADADGSVEKDKAKAAFSPNVAVEQAMDAFNAAAADDDESQASEEEDTMPVSAADFDVAAADQNDNVNSSSDMEDNDNAIKYAEPVLAANPVENILDAAAAEEQQQPLDSSSMTSINDKAIYENEPSSNLEANSDPQGEVDKEPQQVMAAPAAAAMEEEELDTSPAFIQDETIEDEQPQGIAAAVEPAMVEGEQQLENDPASLVDDEVNANKEPSFDLEAANTAEDFADEKEGEQVMTNFADQTVMEEQLVSPTNNNNEAISTNGPIFDLEAAESILDLDEKQEEQAITADTELEESFVDAAAAVDEAASFADPDATTADAEEKIALAASANDFATAEPKKSFAPGSNGGSGYKIVADTGFMGGLSSGGKSIVIAPVSNYAAPTTRQAEWTVEPVGEKLDSVSDDYSPVAEEVLDESTEVPSADAATDIELETEAAAEQLQNNLELESPTSSIDKDEEQFAPWMAAGDTDETKLPTVEAEGIEPTANASESKPPELAIAPAENEEAVASSMNLRPKQYWRARNMTESARPVEKVVGLDIFSAHVIDDSFRSSTMLGETLDDQIQHMSAEADNYDLMKFIILQRREAHEREIQSFEIVLAPNTSGDFGWTLYNMDEFVGHTEVDDGILGGSLFVGPCELAEVTVNYIDSTERIGTGTPIRGEEETVIRCANRGAEWYINGELVAATPQFRRGICANGVPAPYVGIQKGSFRFTKIELVDAPARRTPAGLILGDTTGASAVDIEESMQAAIDDKSETTAKSEIEIPLDVGEDAPKNEQSSVSDGDGTEIDKLTTESSTPKSGSLDTTSVGLGDDSASGDNFAGPVSDIGSTEETLRSPNELDTEGASDDVSGIDIWASDESPLSKSTADLPEDAREENTVKEEAMLESVTAEADGAIREDVEVTSTEYLDAADGTSSVDGTIANSAEVVDSLPASSKAETVLSPKKSYAPTKTMKNVTTSGYLGELTSSTPPEVLPGKDDLPREIVEPAASESTQENVETVLEDIEITRPTEKNDQFQSDETTSADPEVFSESVRYDTPALADTTISSDVPFSNATAVSETPSEEQYIESIPILLPDTVVETASTDTAHNPRKTYAPSGAAMKNVTTSGYLGELTSMPISGDSPDTVFTVDSTESVSLEAGTSAPHNASAPYGSDDSRDPLTATVKASPDKRSYAPTKNMRNVTTSGYLGELTPVMGPSSEPSPGTVFASKIAEPEPMLMSSASNTMKGIDDLNDTSPVYMRQLDTVAATLSPAFIEANSEAKIPQAAFVAAGQTAEYATAGFPPTKSFAPGSGPRRNATSSGYLGKLDNMLQSPAEYVDNEPHSKQKEPELANGEHGSAENIVHVNRDLAENETTAEYTSTLREFSVGPKMPGDASDSDILGKAASSNVASGIKNRIEKQDHASSDHGENDFNSKLAEVDDSEQHTPLEKHTLSSHKPHSTSSVVAIEKASLPFFFATTEVVAESEDEIDEVTPKHLKDLLAAKPNVDNNVLPEGNLDEIIIPPPLTDISHKAERAIHQVEKQVTEVGGAFVSEAVKKMEEVWMRIKESKPFRPIPIPDIKLDESPAIDTQGMTERIMKRIPQETQASGAGGVSTWEGFLKAEENWSKLKESKPFRPRASNLAPQFVVTDGTLGNPKCWEKLRQQRDQKLDYDVVVCGGTLGIFFATALQLKGLNVAVLEAGKLRGREQEWNISMEELLELKRLGILSQDDIDAAIKTEFPGCRSGFKNAEVTPLEGGYFDNGLGYECVTNDVLNLGVSPSILIERVAERFKKLGGVIREDARLRGVTVSANVGSALDLGTEMEPITSSLVLDCMGNASPITRQQRWGVKPDGICAVVGSCAGGYEKKTNLMGDIIYTNTEIQDKGENGKLQYFWEAFPVGIGRSGNGPGSSDVKTTYMFTYMDANQNRPTLESLMEDYWKLLPKYQRSIRNPETDLDIKRVLFAYFPTYRDSPLKPQWDRVLAVGDASGIQSPLSFGGFAALTRHLDRISSAVADALENDCLRKDELSEINAYTPNLSAAWMFQKAMSVRMGQKVDPKFINRLLAGNFEIMDSMGERTIKPFLQDIIKLDSLVGSLARSFLADPTFMPEIVKHVGIPTLVEWVGHVSMMGVYTALDLAASPILNPLVKKMEDPKEQFQWRRRMEAWKFGSGRDYVFSPSKPRE